MRKDKRPARRAQAPPAHPSKQFAIRLERAAILIARTRCDTRAPCRAVGLHTPQSAALVRAICDQRGIPRRCAWGMPLSIWKTTEPAPVYVKEVRER